MEIAVYEDRGVGQFCATRLVAELQRYFTPHGWRVGAISARDILDRPAWGRGLRLLAVPGGGDLAYRTALGAEGARRIWRYVAGGGNYLGICAGAYFAARRLRYADALGLEMAEPRELGLYPGTAAGPPPGFPRIAPTGFAGSALARLTVPGPVPRRAVLYMLGGPAFYPDPPRPSGHAGAAAPAALASDEEAIADVDPDSVEILARYATVPERPAAAVRIPVGLGVAVLSGVHPEISGPDLARELEESGEASPELMDLAEDLTERDAGRRAFLDHLLRALDLE